MSALAQRTMLVVLVTAVSMASASAATAPGNGEVIKLIASALDIAYGKTKKIDAAEAKLLQAAGVCQRRGCSSDLHASVYGYLAIVHWFFDPDHARAIRDLKTMRKIDPAEELDSEYATKALEQAWKIALADGSPAPIETSKAKTTSATEQKREASADQPRAPEGEKADEARKSAEEKKEAERRAAEEKKEAARLTAEERKNAARKAAEEKKQAAEEKKQAARLAVQEKKEAARKAAEDARKAAEEKKEAARKAAEDARKAAEEKKEAARKAAEEKKADEARKAEEARLVELDRRLKSPPPLGALVETPFKGQAIGYPIPIRVKLGPPPPDIEPERVEVVKVITEYAGPGVPSSVRLELKPAKGGSYEGTIPCELTAQEGEVTYFTTAFNKYDNVVAQSGSNSNPHKVEIRGDLAASLPHFVGELPPRSCADSQPPPTRAKTAPNCPGGVGCKQSVDCEGEGCGSVPAAAPLPTASPRGGGCAGCAVERRAPIGPGSTALLLLALVYEMRRRRPRTRTSIRQEHP